MSGQGQWSLFTWIILSANENHPDAARSNTNSSSRRQHPTDSLLPARTHRWGTTAGGNSGLRMDNGLAEAVGRRSALEKRCTIFNWRRKQCCCFVGCGSLTPWLFEFQSLRVSFINKTKKRKKATWFWVSFQRRSFKVMITMNPNYLSPQASWSQGNRDGVQWHGMEVLGFFFPPKRRTSGISAYIFSVFQSVQTERRTCLVEVLMT